jgi:phosphoribosylanthranilate isomerase
MIKIKICGLKRKEDIIIINKYKPDYIGFIFAEGRKRTIGIDKAKKLYNMLDHNIKAVGVFLNQDISYIESLLPYIDLIQLHGNEDEEYIKRLKLITNKPIINAYRQDVNADYILLDNINPGSGEVFDWATIKKYNKPIFLAGGINISNIDDALKLNPYCIDVSSGVEIDGFKDETKIKEIIGKVRDYE